jgi:FYVE/RhoGEF/PH domain-containing protein 3
VKMELGRSPSTPQEEAISPLGVLGTGPSSSPLGKLQALPIGPGAHRGAHSSSAPAGDSSTREPSGAMKIPNRDSGIDSPSSSVASENFPCEESSEGSPSPAILGLPSETASDSRVPQDNPQEEEDSGMGEEPDPKVTLFRPQEDVSLTQVSLPPSTFNLGYMGSAGDVCWVTPTPCAQEMLPIHSFHTRGLLGRSRPEKTRRSTLIP